MMEKLKTLIRGTINMDKLKKDGLIVGTNFHAMEGCIIDPGHCWLIEIGDNVTLAPRVHILAHDASTKNALGYTKIDTVKIGSNVFIGAGSFIMPGAEIPDNCIIGAGSVVTKKLTDSAVYVGAPCRFLCSYEDYMASQKKLLEEKPVFDESYIIGRITEEKKNKMRNDLKTCGGGFVV